jgi:hypothetical protein
MRSCVALFLACELLLVATIHAHEREATVGPLGSPERLTIRGLKSVPPHEVSKALFADLDVAYASFPDAPLVEFKRLLVEKTILGLRAAGFPWPQVSIADRLDRLELNVQEGPRWKAGEIRVRGAQAADVGKLIDGLLLNEPATASSADRESSWATGVPAHLDEPSRRQLARRVDKLLAQQGYTRASSKVEVVGEPARATALLMVTILDEGIPARVGDIELVGNKIHTRDQIFAYLQLPAEAILTADLCRQIEERLNSSGRFVGCRFYPPAKGSSPRLWLDEFAQAPRLDEPLSAEEEALIKLAAWVDGFEQRNEDLLLSFSDGGRWCEFILSPRQGFILQVGERQPPTQPDGFDLAVVYSADQVALYSRQEARKWVVNFSGTKYVLKADFHVNDLAKKRDGLCGANFWLGRRWRPRAESRQPHQPIGLRLTPAAALSIVRKHHAKCTWDGPILSAQWNDRKLRVDSRDGRLVDLAHVEPKVLFFFEKADAEKQQWTLAPVRGMFDTPRDEIASATAEFPNMADPQRLAACIVEFICRQFESLGLSTNKRGMRLGAALIRLAQRGALQPFDDLFAAAMWRQPEQFFIPAIDPPEDSGLSYRFSETGIEFSVRQLPVGLADELFARGSHPWLVWREAAFIMAGKREHVHERLAALFPPDQTGPLTTLALAEAMRAAGMADDAGNWVRPRLEYISLDGFRRDYADLIQPGSRISNYVLTIAESLRGLDQAEAATLFYRFRTLRWMSNSQINQALDFLAEMRRDPNRTTEAAIGAALDNLWQYDLKHRVEKRLKTIADAARHPDRQPPQASRRRFLFR